MRAGVDLADDGPDDADKLPGHGCGHLALMLAHSAETAVTRTESFLGLPGDGLHPVRRGGGLGLQMACLAGGDASVPRRFHPDPPDMAVAGLGDPAGAALGSRGVFAGNQAEETHQLPRCVEAGDVAELGEDGDGTQDMDPPEADQGGHQGSQRPVLGGGVDLILEIRHPPRGLPGGIHILLEDDLLHRAVEGLGLQPARVGLRPAAAARIDAVVPEEERAKALTGFCLQGFHVLTGPGQVPHRLLFRVGNPDRRERSRPVFARQHRRIPPIRLDAIRGPSRHKPRRDDHAVMTRLRDLPIDAIPTGPGFITEAEHEPIRTQALDQVPEGGSMVGNRPLPLRSRPARPGNGHRNRILVDIKTHIGTVFKV